jgi:hypothetical protein
MISRAQTVAKIGRLMKKSTNANAPYSHRDVVSGVKFFNAEIS